MSKLRMVDLFADPFEREHVFDMLDEWAKAPDSTELPEVYSPDSYIRQQVKRVTEAINEIEMESRGEIGFSHQSQTLCELDEVLAFALTSADLRRDMSKLKILLREAQEIVYEMNQDKLRPLAEHGAQMQGRKADAFSRLKKEVINIVGKNGKRMNTADVVESLYSLEWIDEVVKQNNSKWKVEYRNDDGRLKKTTKLTEIVKEANKLKYPSE